MTSGPYLKIGVCDARCPRGPAAASRTPYERELDVSRSADSSKIADFSTRGGLGIPTDQPHRDLPRHRQRPLHPRRMSAGIFR
jgi:hypothetical protein